MEFIQWSQEHDRIINSFMDVTDETSPCFGGLIKVN